MADPSTWYSSAEHHSQFDKDAFIASLGSSSLQCTVAQQLDARDQLAALRKEYHLPSMSDIGVSEVQSGSSSSADVARPQTLDEPALYLCGNSLGPMPVRSRQLLDEELAVWGARGVLGHFDHPHQRPWAKQEEQVRDTVADLVGARPDEVAIMGTLTTNIHSVFDTFYRPHVHPQGLQMLLNKEKTASSGSTTDKKQRHKIVYERKAFPSDIYALDSIVRMQGFKPETSLVALAPREGEMTLRTEDVLMSIEQLGEEGETAIIMLSGIQYFTGQWFEMEKITKKAKSYDMIVGWDLAHAYANVPLALHDWGVDFAVWCTYKYGSSGPGGIAGLFIHEKWHSLSYEELPRPAGWYGHDKATRFAMPSEFLPERGAAGWIQSNPGSLNVVALQGSLETIARVPKLVGAPSATAATGKSVGEGSIMPILRQRSLRLTAYLEHLLLSEEFAPKHLGVSIVTPTDAHQRGSQLCVRIPNPASTSSATEAPPNGQVNGGAESKKQTDGDDVPPPIDSKTLLARAHKRAEKQYGLVADVRNPDMLRLAPLAHFSSFEDVWRAAHALSTAIKVEMASPS